MTVVLVSGWTSTIQSPPSVGDSVVVMLVSEGHHCGVAFPRPEGGFVEFGFGDWAWYALGHESWLDVIPTVLWPTPGCLSRREFSARTPDLVGAAYPAAKFSPLPVSAVKAEALRSRLEGEFAAGLGALRTRPELQMSFVPYPKSYWFGNTCADVSADWLRALGCTVEGGFLCLNLVLR